MNKLLKIIIFTLCIIIGTVSYSYAEEHTATITANVIASYIIDMPSSISLPYDNPNSIECCIKFPEVSLEEGYGLKVSIVHDNFKNNENSSYEIPYTTDLTESIITKKNNEFCFKVYIDKLYLSTSLPGKYTSKITVTIEYVKL